MRIKTDVVIVGTGVAGMFSALKLPRDKKIVIITKEDMRSSDSFLAQGGICVLRDENDYDSYFEDTMKAGHYENRKESVDIMIRGSRDIINDLVGYGVDFKMDGDDFAYTREGAHSRPRILYHEDITGKEISEKLLQQVLKLENVTILEYTTMQDILVENGKCTGLKAVSAEANRARLEAMEAGKAVKTQEEIQPGGEIQVEIYAQDTILASGGIGGRYAHSTNYPHLTGDALDIAKKHNVRLEHLDYVQIHPTTLYSKKPGRRFLISESVRGEGAVLYNSKKERFVNELLPRDVVAEAIFKQMEKDQTDYVYEDLRPIGKEEIASHFPHIVEHCKEKGYDVFKEPIPVVPAQHYFMGGIKVDYDSHTSMKHLYAIGETACNGVHGKNRLASNSLLESLVFAKRAAKRIEKSLKERAHYMFDQTTLKLNVDPLIISALKEDITSEDVSTNSVMPFSKTGVVDLICKEDGIICGLQIFERTFELLDEACDVEFFASDGDHVEKGQLLGRVKGDVRILLSGERVALNYLQRMSGIATYTANVQEYLRDSSIRLLDTRKTTPNNRIFEKYAVRVGGGHNHRYNLSDGVLLKDNHIGAAGGVKEAIMLAKEYAPFVRKIEIEVENMEMVKEAVEAGADIIMLDNMDDDMLKEAIAYIDHRAEIEVSGNVTKENIARLTNLGVDYVSSGALTHSAPILDLSLKNLHVI